MKYLGYKCNNYVLASFVRRLNSFCHFVEYFELFLFFFFFTRNNNILKKDDY